MVRIQGFHCLGLGSISGQGTESHKMCGEAKKKKKKIQLRNQCLEHPWWSSI